MKRFNILNKTTKASNKVFGVPLDQLVERQGNAIPDLVYQCVRAIEKGIETPGLLVVAPKKVKVQLLRKQFEDSDLDVSKSKDVHEVAELLKSFLIELPDPLLTNQRYDLWTDISRMDAGEAKVNALQSLLAQLPPANKVIVGYLITFLRKLLEYKKNQLTSAAIARYIGPALLHPRDGPQELNAVCSVCVSLVEDYPAIMKASFKTVVVADNPSSPNPQNESFDASSPARLASKRLTTSASSPAVSPVSARTALSPGAYTTPISARTNTSAANSPSSGTPTIKSPAATAATNKLSKSPASPRSSSPATSPRSSPNAVKSTVAARAAIVANNNAAVRKAAAATTSTTGSTSTNKQSPSAASNRKSVALQQPIQLQQQQQQQQQQKEEPKLPENARPALMRMKATYEFGARDDTEISMSVGSLVDVVAKDASGWWWGRNVGGNGKIGLFPSNYCEVVEVFNSATKKLRVSQRSLSSAILQKQRECGFVKNSASQSKKLVVSKSATIAELQKKMSSMKGFPGSGGSSSVATPPRKYDEDDDSQIQVISSPSRAAESKAKSSDTVRSPPESARSQKQQNPSPQARSTAAAAASIDKPTGRKRAPSLKILEMSNKIVESKTIHATPELLAKTKERFSGEQLPKAAQLSLEQQQQEPPQIQGSPVLRHLTLKRAKVHHRRPSTNTLRKKKFDLDVTDESHKSSDVNEIVDMLVLDDNSRNTVVAAEAVVVANARTNDQMFDGDLFGKLKTEMELQQNLVLILQKEKLALVSDLEAAKTELATAKTGLATAKTDLASAKSEVAAATAQSRSEMGASKSELDMLKAKLAELQLSHDALKKENDNLKWESQTNMEGSKAIHKKLEDENKAIQKKLEDERKKLEEENKSVAKKAEEDRKSLQQKFEDEKSAALAKSSNSERLLAQAREDLDALRSVHDNTSARLAAALKELEASKLREQNFLENSRKDLEQLRVVEGESIAKDKTINELHEKNRVVNQEIDEIKSAYKEEQVLRKKYWNMMEDMKGKIRVYCRSRPLHAKEAQAGHKLACTFTDPYTLDVAQGLGSKTFGFDRVFPPNATQEEVFSDTSHLVQSSLDGFNVCIFAYGQTGSGKTHTMMGDEAAGKPGICPRAMALLYDTIKKDEHRHKVSVRCYMLELYNDNLVDLLWKHASEKPPKLNIKKDSKGMVYVENVTIRKASTYEKLQACLRTGLKHRHVSSTKMNDQSSRSHLIFSIMIKSKNLQTKQKSTGKLSFVDLAGSERAAKSGVTDERLKEAMSINKSLSALGNVINALSTGEAFIPYRNNKLTQLMSDSIGGNAKTLMFVNISPNDYNADETVQSLAYGARAKLITNTATQMVESQEVQRLKRVIAQLKAGKPTNDEGVTLDVSPDDDDDDDDHDEHDDGAMNGNGNDSDER